MEHAEEPCLRAEVLGIAGSFEQRRGTGVEEQIVKQLSSSTENSPLRDA
jgi:hypothetical protein